MDGIRPDDSKNSSTIFVSTTSTDDRYFTEQALRAGFLREPKMDSGSDPVREAIQREVEKDRIREEIIASEIMRRRELEAEVRRELGLEREMMMRRGEGFSVFANSSLCSSMLFDQRVSMLSRTSGGLGTFGIGDRISWLTRGEAGVNERLPFQRKPEAVAKIGEGSKGQSGDQVMTLAKPMTTGFIGIKRKTASDLTISGSKKKKSEDEWNCALCHVSATSEEGLNQHFQGKKHKAKEGALRAKTAIGRNGDSASLPEKADKPIKLVKNNAITDPKNWKKQEMSAMQKLKSEDGKMRKFKFWCADCKIGCHSEKVMNNHVRGKKHVAYMERLKQVNDNVSVTKAFNDSADGKEKVTSEEVNEKDVKNISEKVIGKEEMDNVAKSVELPINDEMVGMKKMEGAVEDGVKEMEGAVEDEVKEMDGAVEDATEVPTDATEVPAADEVAEQAQ